MTRMLMGEDPGDEKRAYVPCGALTTAHFKVALNHLRHNVTVVGFLEDLPRFSEAFGREFCLPGLDIRVVKNRNIEFPEDPKVISDPEALAVLQQYTFFDDLLFRWARGRGVPEQY